jgi:hypothetical protein
MQDVAEIEFRGMARSPSLEALIRDRIERLARFGAGLRVCRVIVEADWLTAQGGRSYRVRIGLATARTRIDVGGDPVSGPQHNVCLAISESFHRAEARLRAALMAMPERAFSSG